MGQIIEFNARKDAKRERVEALMKGRVEHYSCDTCGADIEVINGVFPKKCPGCGVDIAEWRE